MAAIGVSSELYVNGAFVLHLCNAYQNLLISQPGLGIKPQALHHLLSGIRALYVVEGLLCYVCSPITI